MKISMMEGIDIEKTVKCSKITCNIILDDVFKIFSHAQNVDTVNHKTIALIKSIATEQKMFLHKYDENKIIWFTLLNEEQENYITVKIILNRLNETNNIYVELQSNLDSDEVYGERH